MDREIEVHIDWDGDTRPVGRLGARAKGARQTCSFAYDQTWLGMAGAFALEPNLPLVRGDAHWDGGLFNAFSDPARIAGAGVSWAGASAASPRRRAVRLAPC